MRCFVYARMYGYTCFQMFVLVGTVFHVFESVCGFRIICHVICDDEGDDVALMLTFVTTTTNSLRSS